VAGRTSDGAAAGSISYGAVERSSDGASEVANPPGESRGGAIAREADRSGPIRRRARKSFHCFLIFSKTV
jgi:hypothetical protein